MTTHLAAFDLDETLLKSNSSFEFGRYLYREKILSLSKALWACYRYLLYRLGFLQVERLHDSIFQRLFRGMRSEVLEEKVAAFVELHLHDMIDHPLWARAQKFRDDGGVVVILSNSPDFLVGPIARYLGIEEWQGTKYEIDKEGKLCHISTHLEGSTKAELLVRRAAELDVPMKDVWVVTDSNLDLPMLEVAGKRTVIRPDRKLRQIAVQRGWEIIER